MSRRIGLYHSDAYPIVDRPVPVYARAVEDLAEPIDLSDSAP